MQRLENMFKIIEFICVMIILLSLFLVATSIKLGHECVYAKDCIELRCPYPSKPRCLKNKCDMGKNCMDNHLYEDNEYFFVLVRHIEYLKRETKINIIKMR
ncbi:unnamed protein product [Trifolium pratense]|uniref:Uncharacterized protein n=1 Tax=Trifolium pratense TaxID=57577 RepID=A0ACB0LKG4_TRIPR|nr:unnamed protein product [Trifolium pratense]